MKKNNVFKKVALLCSTVIASGSSMFALSAGGAAALGTAGAIAGIALITKLARRDKTSDVKYNSKKKHKSQEYKEATEKTKLSKKDVRNNIKVVKSKIRNHQRAIKRLDVNDPEVAQHRTEISTLKTKLSHLKTDLKNM